MNISADTVDLWTNITNWTYREEYVNNQQYSQLPRKLDHLFYQFTDDEIEKLKNVTSVSIPFAYWRGGNNDCPARARPYSALWHEGNNPNVFGRLKFTIEQAPVGYYSPFYQTKDMRKF